MLKTGPRGLFVNSGVRIKKGYWGKNGSFILKITVCESSLKCIKSIGINNNMRFFNQLRVMHSIIDHFFLPSLPSDKPRGYANV